MLFNIDLTIFVGFLLVNLIVGLSYGTKVKTLSDYATGGRNFSTATIVATLIATWIGGGFFMFNLSKAYSDGLPFIVAVAGNGIAVFILGFFYGPRVGEFLGCNSVAEALGTIYGKHVRLIASVAAILLAAGYTGVQIRVLSNLVNWSLGISATQAAIASTAIVIIYSAFGGIRSVTFTDVIQFLAFGSFIPGLALLIWGSMDDPGTTLKTVSEHQLFDYHNLFTFSWVVMVFWFTLPCLDPSLFQRILMAKNVLQVRRSFMIAAIGCVAIIMTTSWIGIMMFAKNPGLEPDQIMNYIIDNFSYTGLKGCTMAGIAAMVMSTADSYINSAAVLFANDFCKTLNIKIKNKNSDLILSRFFAVSIGIFALCLALSSNNLYELTLIVTNFYMPIVTMPMTLAIFGFRTTTKSILIGMGGGFSTVILWRLFLLDTGIDSVMPAVFMNLFFTVGSHYLLRQPGGWVGIKDKSFLNSIKLSRKRKFNNLFYEIKNFNFMKFCKKNSPNSDASYSLFGVFCIISVYSTMYSLPFEVRAQHATIVEFIYHSVLISATVFLCYPIWPPTFKKEWFINLAWIFGVPYILVVAPTLLVLASNLGQLQLMIFMINLIIIAIMLRWQIALLMIFGGVYLGVEIYKSIMGVVLLPTDFGSLEFKLAYFLLMISSILLAFFKPKQDLYEASMAKGDLLKEQVNFRDLELSKLVLLKNELIQNINHEVNIPVTGVASLSKILYDNYSFFTEEQIKESIGTIAKNSERLISLTTNLVDLSKLNSLKFDLRIIKIDLSQLLYSRIEICKKSYDDYAASQEFVLDIAPEIYINCDEHLLTQTLDNLIINALTYCQNGKINIKLEQTPSLVKFSIKDEGIGVPREELQDIFGAFVVSSRTKTPSGGRGIGLAVCKKVINMHGGEILAENNSNDKGTTFKFTIPKKPNIKSSNNDAY